MRLKRQINTTLSNYGESQEAKAELNALFLFSNLRSQVLPFCPLLVRGSSN